MQLTVILKPVGTYFFKISNWDHDQNLDSISDLLRVTKILNNYVEPPNIQLEPQIVT